MKGFKEIFLHEMQTVFTEKRHFLFAIALPLLLFLFFTTLLKDGVPRDLPVVVVDYDRTALSRQLIAQLDATPEMKITEHLSSEEIAKTKVQSGKAYAVIIFPARFEQDVKQGRATEVLNFYNGTYLLPSGLINKAFQKVVGTFSAGASIQSRMKKGSTAQQATLNYKPVNLSAHVLFNPYTNYSYYLNTGFMPMMLQIFVMLTTIYSLGITFKSNKGKALYALSNENYIVAILGKALPYTLIFFVIGTIMNIMMFVWQGFPLNGSKLLLTLNTLLLIISHQAIGIFFVASAKSLRAALTGGTGVSAVSLSFAGLTFPIMGMPLAMQALSYIFPFTHYLKVFVDQGQRGSPIFYSLPSIAAMFVITMIAMLGWKKIKVHLQAGAYPEHI
ncbi:ABC-2 type transport system permease protein [Pedobacter sp. CG_S7]|uniref:ABC transporter permease n=1 Tax=Pedobacter sp. CG_S7 TaxID=3143930 RepID=UPI0033931D52